MTHTSEHINEVPPGEEIEEPRAWYRHWGVKVAGALAIVGLAVAGAAYAYADAVAGARQAYAQAVSQAREAFSELDRLAAQATQLTVDCVDKTGDENVCQELSLALDDVPAMPQFDDGTTLGKSALEAGKESADEVASLAREHVSVLMDRVDAVTAAITALEVKTAQEALASSIDAAQEAADTAQELLASTDGMVSDEQTRVDLQTSLDELNSLIGQAREVSGDDLETYQEMKAQLDQGVADLEVVREAVSSSHEAFAVSSNEQPASQSHAQSGGRQASASAPSRSTSQGSAPARTGSSAPRQAPAPAPAPAPAQAPAAAPAPAPAPAPKPAAPTLSRMDWACVGTTDGLPSKCRAECYDQNGAPYYGPLYGLTTEAGVPVTQCWGPYV